MTKSMICGFILGCIILLAPLRGQEEEPLREAVAVTNIEVPVRVFSGEQSVPGLLKDDFQVSEDGIPQQINGFYSFHKKINADTAGESLPDPQTPGRYFVLIFRTYEYNEPLAKGLNYLFEKIMRPQDQLLVMANSRTLMIERLGSDGQAREKIQELVKTESLAAYNRMETYLRSIEQSLNMTKFRMTLGGKADLGADYLTGFLQSYLRAWQEFKSRYLSLDIDKFYYFSKHLERIHREKWVLNFYQLEQFPQIAFSGETERLLRTYIYELTSSINPTAKAQGQIMARLLQSIDMALKVADDFPSEEVSKLFYKVNATFHSFFMRVFRDAGGTDLQFRNVATDLENSLRSLTEMTGGALIASNDIPASLAAVSEKTDDYYMLTYEPAHPKKIGKIKVTVRDRKYKVLFDNNIRADYISDYLKKKEAESPGAKIKDLAFRDKKLSFIIDDFSQTKIKDQVLGVLTVRIRIKNAQNQSFFDQNKSLQASKKPFSLSLNFNFLPAGKYDVILDVLDQVSGKTITAVIQPLVD